MCGRCGGNCALADLMLAGASEAMDAAAKAELPFNKRSRRLMPSVLCAQRLSSVDRGFISSPWGNRSGSASGDRRTSSKYRHAPCVINFAAEPTYAPVENFCRNARDAAIIETTILSLWIECQHG